MLGQRCSALLVQCRWIVYDAGPTLIYHQVCCILCANTRHSTNAVSMLTHSLGRWPVIEAALVYCTVFSDWCILLVTLQHPGARNTRQHDTLAQCCCNAGPQSAMLGLPLFQSKPFKLLTTNIIGNIFFLKLLKKKVLNLRTCIMKRYIVHVHKDWCAEMWTVSHTQ